MAHPVRAAVAVTHEVQLSRITRGQQWQSRMNCSCHASLECCSSGTHAWSAVVTHPVRAALAVTYEVQLSRITRGQRVKRFLHITRIQCMKGSSHSPRVYSAWRAVLMHRACAVHEGQFSPITHHLQRCSSGTLEITLTAVIIITQWHARTLVMRLTAVQWHAGTSEMRLTAVVIITQWHAGNALLPVRYGWLLLIGMFGRAR